MNKLFSVLLFLFLSACGTPPIEATNAVELTMTRTFPHTDTQMPTETNSATQIPLIATNTATIQPTFRLPTPTIMRTPKPEHQEREMNYFCHKVDGLYEWCDMMSQQLNESISDSQVISLMIRSGDGLMPLSDGLFRFYDWKYVNPNKPESWVDHHAVACVVREVHIWPHTGGDGSMIAFCEARLGDESMIIPIFLEEAGYDQRGVFWLPGGELIDYEPGMASDNIRIDDLKSIFQDPEMINQQIIIQIQGEAGQYVIPDRVFASVRALLEALETGICEDIDSWNQLVVSYLFLPDKFKP